MLEILSSVSDLNFRIIEWEIGDVTSQTNTVTLQMFSSEAKTLDQVMDVIEKQAENEEI